MTKLISVTSWIALTTIAAASGCAAGSSTDEGEKGGSGTSGSGASGPINTGATNGEDDLILDQGSAPAACGDGITQEGEFCDDANTEDGDGCSFDCLFIEAGFSCPQDGQPCRPFSVCGDGFVASTERCDDGNLEDGDGCSSRCFLERGYKCEGEPSDCSETTCGDLVVEGTESCDDGNLEPFDGCSSLCQGEPDCSGGGPCTSTCGDGLAIGEECDDGNLDDGDGCSSTCTVEPGWTCENNSGVSEVIVPVTYRDFRHHADSAPGAPGHPDFNPNVDDEDLIKEETGSDFFCATAPNLIQTTLDEDGKPALRTDLTQAERDSAFVHAPEDFAQWYRDTEFSIAFYDFMTLDENTGKFTFENDEFFPVDYRGWSLHEDREELFEGYKPPPTGNPCAAAINNLWCYTDPPTGVDECPAGGELQPVWHNFHFTSEVRYWFQYDPADQATFFFKGDDDVFVFVAGKLVVDIGGIHVPIEREFTLDDSLTDVTGAPLGLEAGQVYEVAVFQAERNPGGSTYKLELGGFDLVPSTCVPFCGDGVVAGGEECDDGVNDGGYDECQPECVLGPRCGDGVVQPEEFCDDGNQVNSDGCSNACDIPPTR